MGGFLPHRDFTLKKEANSVFQQRRRRKRLNKKISGINCERKKRIFPISSLCRGGKGNGFTKLWRG